MAEQSEQNAENEAPKTQSKTDPNLSWDEAFAEKPGDAGQASATEEPTAPAVDVGSERSEAQDVQMGELKPTSTGKKQVDLDFLLDIPLDVSVEVGRTKMVINDLLQLNQGSVIELSKLVGEPFEVLVNDKLVARGEVVVVNERFGVRLTDIISPLERIEQLS